MSEEGLPPFVKSWGGFYRLVIAWLIVPYRFLLFLFKVLRMSTADWLVLICTLVAIVAYGVYKSRGSKSIDGFLLGNQSLPWYHICLSVMATQASAITFLSAPGLAYSTGMGFVQFYFGLPLAMIVLSITFVPIFHKLKVYTAYEFLEKRFDVKTRALTAFLFLIQRGLSTGVTIYAPAIILSVILDISTVYTTFFIGGLVIFYTVYGGTKAVSYTQLLQMAVIFTGLILAGIMVVRLLPDGTGFIKAIHIAGKSGRTKVLDFSFDVNNQYTVWSGLIGGFFLQLSYFGTDQSQVGRYLTGASVNQSRLGLLMNGLVKIPMQFLILLIGILVFTFYQFHASPLFFNSYELGKLKNSKYANELQVLVKEHAIISAVRSETANKLAAALDKGNEKVVKTLGSEMLAAETRGDSTRAKLVRLMQKNDPKADTNDTNYVFLAFVTRYLPKGLVGLLIAIIFLASMGSTASALNSLASTTVVDVYKRFIRPDGLKSPEESGKHYVAVSRLATFGWGLVCIFMALYAARLGNLLEAVNKLGSLFYGTILGIFIVAFYLKKITGSQVFIAALITEVIILILWQLNIMAFLWLNVVGCGLVVLCSLAVRLARR